MFESAIAPIRPRLLASGADARMRALYRAASPTQKLAVVSRLNAALVALKDAELKVRYANMPAKQRREALRRWWLTSRD